MGRLVEPSRAVTIEMPRRSGGDGPETRTMTVGGDDFMGRVAKYVPSEVLAGYMALDRHLVPDPGKVVEARSATRAGAAQAVAMPQSADAIYNAALPYLPAAVLVIGLVFTPLYIRQLAARSEPGTPWVTHAVVSTFAFIVWAYAIQGSFFTTFATPIATSIYHGSIASALIILFTLASGLFSPAPLAPHEQ